LGTAFSSAVLPFGCCAGIVQLTGSVMENPHGLHWNTYTLSEKACLIVCRNVIVRPQTGQTTSPVGAAFSVMAHL
jgi:hypothetical protein